VQQGGDQSAIARLAEGYGQRFVETDWLPDVISRFGLRA
jgi:hypothetical protein